MEKGYQHNEKKEIYQAVWLHCLSWSHNERSLSILYKMFRRHNEKKMKDDGN